MRFFDIDTVFLDAGGTLIHLDLDAIVVRLAECGVDCSASALDRAVEIGKPAVSRFRTDESTEGAGMVGRYVRTVLDILAEDGAIAHSPRELDEVTVQLTTWLGDPEISLRIWSRVRAGTREGLQSLRSSGRTLVVVSNSDGRCDERLIDSGLMPFLDGVVDSGRVGVEKPDPGIFHHALEAYGADPNRTLHVGDLYDIDGIGASAAGIRPVLVDPHGAWQKDLADRQQTCATVPDIAGLAQALRK